MKFVKSLGYFLVSPVVVGYIFYVHLGAPIYEKITNKKAPLLKD